MKLRVLLVLAICAGVFMGAATPAQAGGGNHGHCPSGYVKLNDQFRGLSWTADKDYETVILVGGPPMNSKNKDPDGRNKVFHNVEAGDTISREAHGISHICVKPKAEPDTPTNTPERPTEETPTEETPTEETPEEETPKETPETPEEETPKDPPVVSVEPVISVWERCETGVFVRNSGTEAVAVTAALSWEKDDMVGSALLHHQVEAGQTIHVAPWKVGTHWKVQVYETSELLGEGTFESCRKEDGQPVIDPPRPLPEFPTTPPEDRVPQVDGPQLDELPYTGFELNLLFVAAALIMAGVMILSLAQSTNRKALARK